MAYLFSVLIGVALIGFLVYVMRLGVNCYLMKHIGADASALFLGILCAVLALYLGFWIGGNIIFTLKALGVIALPLLFGFQKFLKSHSKINK